MVALNRSRSRRATRTLTGSACFASVSPAAGADVAGMTAVRTLKSVIAAVIRILGPPSGWGIVYTQGCARQNPRRPSQIPQIPRIARINRGLISPSYDRLCRFQDRGIGSEYEAVCQRHADA